MQQLAVGRVEARVVDLEQAERIAARSAVDRAVAVAAHLRVVADPLEQPVHDARRAARAPRDLERGRVVGIGTSRMPADRADDAARAPASV